MQVGTGELVRVALVDDGGQVGELLADDGCTLLHDEVVLILHFLQELSVCTNVLKQRLKLHCHCSLRTRIITAS